jgi:hypothetical protein
MNDQITYMRAASGDLAVYLEHRRVGTITSIESGFAYVPAGRTKKDRGATFKTEQEVHARRPARLLEGTVCARQFGS